MTRHAETIRRQNVTKQNRAELARLKETQEFILETQGYGEDFAAISREVSYYARLVCPHIPNEDA